MKGEKDEKKVDQRSYSFAQCSCGIKLHINADTCWKCGGKPIHDHYYSNNPDDALYSKSLCSIKKCMNCYNINYLGKEPCQRIPCFASGKGNCEACRISHPEIFICCQETMKDEPPPTEKEWKRLKDMLGCIGKPKPTSQPAAPTEFEDDIPF